MAHPDIRIPSQISAHRHATCVDETAGAPTLSLLARREHPIAVYEASGEIDASNSTAVQAFVGELVSTRRNFVFDLSRVAFIDLSGFRALTAIDEQCQKAGLTWALVPSKAVSHLLHVLDCDTLLPTRSSPAVASEKLASTDRRTSSARSVTSHVAPGADK